MVREEQATRVDLGLDPLEPRPDVLVVRRDDGREAMVPFVAALVPEVDLAAGRVLVEDRPGLLDPED